MLTAFGCQLPVSSTRDHYALPSPSQPLPLQLPYSTFPSLPELQSGASRRAHIAPDSVHGLAGREPISNKLPVRAGAKATNTVEVQDIIIFI